MEKAQKKGVPSSPQSKAPHSTPIRPTHFPPLTLHITYPSRLLPFLPLTPSPSSQNSRDGDPNAMLRLAKMYLHGQGCQRSVGMAQEWLRKARYLGVGASLDELYATEVSS